MPRDASPISRILAITTAAIGWTLSASAGEPDDLARIRRAVAYLDGRQDAWASFGTAHRGKDADRTTCVSCHTGVGFALARPSLGRVDAKAGPSAPEARTIAAVRLRVEHWADLDSPRFRLMYDHDARKKVESRGTEAVLDALILARSDAERGRGIGDPTRIALENLWAAQKTEGDDAGSWDWLNFGLEPWEANGSAPFGAALAAIAVGSAPGYLDGKLDERAAKGVASLRAYLGRKFDGESLYNRLWILEASTQLEGLLADDRKRKVIDQLVAARREDGGWALATLGEFERLDGTPQASESDGYATGLALHTLIRAGRPSTGEEVSRAVAWLRTHQQPDGSWPGRSLNKERDPATFIGHLMTDAATAIAAQALVEAMSP